MKKQVLASALIGIFFAAALVLLSGTSVFAQKIPGLVQIPPDLPLDVRVRLMERREALEKDLADFLAAARAFNAKAAKDQSDSEYKSLDAWRTRYIEAAKAFNRDVAAAPGIAQPPAKTTQYMVQIGSARGEFSVESSDGSRLTNGDLQTGRVARVDTGTRVRTGANGHVQFILPDETVFTIGAKSDMVIDEFVYDKENAEKISVNLTIGLFRWVTGKVARKEPASLKVNTSFGGGGFRGTDVETFVAPDGSGYMKLFSGMLEITPKNGSAPFMMKAPSVVKFNSDGTFSPPKPITE